MRSAVAVCLIGVLVSAPLQAKSNEFDDRMNWFRVRELQAEHVPEIGVELRWSELAGEEGLGQRLKFRKQLKEVVGLVAIAQRQTYESTLLSGVEDRANFGTLAVVFERPLRNLLQFDIESGHAGGVGGGVSLDGSLLHDLNLRASLSSRADRDSRIALQVEQRIDRAALDFNLSARRFLFAQGFVEQDWLTLEKHGDLRGKEWGAGMSFGAQWLSRRPVMLGGYFYDREFRVQDPLPFRFAATLSHGVRHFSAGDDFSLRLPRTRRSELSQLALSLDLPVSRRLGFKFFTGVGQDLERKLDFGKIRELNGLVRLQPTVRYQFSAGLQHRTENAGNLSGVSDIYTLAMQVNL